MPIARQAGSGPARPVYGARTALTGSWLTEPVALTDGGAEGKGLLMRDTREAVEAYLRRIMDEFGWRGHLCEWYTVRSLSFDEACRLNLRVMQDHARSGTVPEKGV